MTGYYLLLKASRGYHPVTQSCLTGCRPLLTKKQGTQFMPCLFPQRVTYFKSSIQTSVSSQGTSQILGQPQSLFRIRRLDRLTGVESMKSAPSVDKTFSCCDFAVALSQIPMTQPYFRFHIDLISCKGFTFLNVLARKRERGLSVFVKT
jgi:hypothetical protein